MVTKASNISLWIKISASVATMSLSCMSRLAPAEYSLALGSIAFAAMLVVVTVLRNDMDRFIQQNQSSDTTKDEDGNVTFNADTARFIKWHVTLAFPGLPLMVMAVSNAWVTRFQYEVIVIAAEFVCKVRH
jgi:hypothetical protein